METESLLPRLQGPHRVPTLDHTKPIRNFESYFLNINLEVFFHLRLVLQSGPFP
jgi:hypothetical protein